MNLFEVLTENFDGVNLKEVGITLDYKRITYKVLEIGRRVSISSLGIQTSLRYGDSGIVLGMSAKRKLVNPVIVFQVGYEE